MHTPERPLLVIIGPTASGKSALAVELALRYGGEIISADSRQVYQRLDEAVGKQPVAERKGVPHHLLSVVSPGEYYSAHRFVEDACSHTQELHSRGRLPIVAGGTGFYIEGLLFEGSFSAVVADPSYRASLQERDLQDLQEELKKKDAAAYERIDIRNPRRLIRALEVIRALGVFPMRKRIKRYDYHMIGITHNRPRLYERIQERLAARFSAMTGEIQSLLDDGVDPHWLDSLGLECRGITRMLTQKVSEAETREWLLRAIFAYAKRQETWFRRYPEAQWYREHEFKQLYRELDALYST